MADDEDPDEETIWIHSTRDRHDFGPACWIGWGELEWYASVEQVRLTALHLVLAAAYADMIGGLLADGLPKPVVVELTSRILSSSPAVAATLPKHQRARGMLGSRHTLEIIPVGSSTAKQGRVQIARGGKRAAIDTATATQMALTWLSAAEATESDTLFSQVVERSSLLSTFDADALFGLLADIRSGQAQLPPARTGPMG